MCITRCLKRVCYTLLLLLMDKVMSDVMSFDKFFKLKIGKNHRVQNEKKN